ncbi:Polysaccharide deacetylase [Thermodesulfovibrio sp. N1]|uniref:polysaccharide deacetylase family protein n=1 Tax=Thermodesulfovibrio sp. N1 TaxID=1871110 RepID=UPI00083A3342|nr:polysaccharide deacetylase family protein [Thermodesulfovibrio sp. N1]ODA43318.1 Polysaccharide deacetylase [Thermodesulfovibrio sp. N1]
MKEFKRRTFLKMLMIAGLGSFFDVPSVFSEEYQKESLPVLLYHEIAYEPLTDYTVIPEDFFSQMELLYSLGFKAILPNELEDNLTKNYRKVIITFDDGSYTFLEYAYPLLKAYNFKVVMNVIGSKVGKGWVISWDEYKEILDDGLIEIGCHSYDFHFPNWSKKLTLKDFERDLVRFKEEAFKHLKKEVTIFSSPLGERLTEEHIKVLEKLKFKHLFVSEGITLKATYYNPTLNKKIIPRFNINHYFSFKDFKNLVMKGEVL